MNKARKKRNFEVRFLEIVVKFLNILVEIWKFFEKNLSRIPGENFTPKKFSYFLGCYCNS